VKKFWIVALFDSSSGNFCGVTEEKKEKNVRLGFFFRFGFFRNGRLQFF
jgi:hypothetical protein